MTNNDVWRCLCAELGLDPLQVSVHPEEVFRSMHALNADKPVKPGVAACDWVGNAINWSGHPKGFAFWSRLRSRLEAAAPGEPVADGGMVRALRVLRVEKL